MKRNISNQLLTAFFARAVSMGYTIKNLEHEKDLFTIHKGEEYICTFAKDSGMRWLSNTEFEQDKDMLYSLMGNMKQVHDLYANGKPLSFDGVKDFRLISEFGDFILAAKLDKDNEVKFVTWSYDYNHTGVICGHYYESDYDGAKQDFALRSGLISKNKLFKEEELGTIYDACVYRGKNDNEITHDDEKMLRKVMDKVEENIPNVIYDGHEQEQSLER